GQVGGVSKAVAEIRAATAADGVRWRHWRETATSSCNLTSALFATHQVSDLALDLGTRGAVARSPNRIALPFARAIEDLVLGMQPDAVASQPARRRRTRARQ